LSDKQQSISLHTWKFNHFIFQGERGSPGMPGYAGEPGEKVIEKNLLAVNLTNN